MRDVQQCDTESSRVQNQLDYCMQWLTGIGAQNIPISDCEKHLETLGVILETLTDCLTAVNCKSKFAIKRTRWSIIGKSRF